MENMNELEEMRRQIQALKDKLERQGVLNEQKVRRSIRSKVNSIDRWSNFSLVIFAYSCLIMLAQMKWNWGYDWVTVIFMGTLILIGGCSDWYVHRLIKNDTCDNLRETVFKLKKIRKCGGGRSGVFAFCYIIPVWAMNLGCDLLGVKALMYPLIGLLVSLIGAVIGCVVCFRWVRSIDKLIAQIKELENSENF